MKRFLVILILFFLPLSALGFQEAFENVASDEIDLEQYFNEANLQSYNLKKNEKFKPVKASEIKPAEKREYKSGDFTLNTVGGETTDKYQREGVEQKHSAIYQKKYFKLSTGVYNSYNGANAQNATNEFYFAPAIKTSKGISLEMNNTVDVKGNYFQQELGVKYTPSFFKNSSFGVSGATKFNKDTTRSEKLKFTTDFYLF